MLGATRDVDPAAPQLDEEQDVQPCREDGIDGEEVTREHARGLGADELAPGDAGSLASGSEASSRRSLRIVVVATLNPSVRSSPAIRW